MKSVLVVLLSLTVFLNGFACCTIMNGTTQKVGIASQPTGAHVMVDNQPRGVTPLFVELKRKDTHIVRVEMEGYKPYEAVITRRVSGWVWGNIFFGGLIGLAVDAIAGSINKLEPEQVRADLNEDEPGSAGS